MKEALEKLKKLKIPLIVLAFGVLLMLLPSRDTAQPQLQGDLSTALSLTEGVGEAYVLVSDNGVVVVCDGAQNAAVRMSITNAVKSFTGFGADKITILKRAEH